MVYLFSTDLRNERLKIHAVIVISPKPKLYKLGINSNDNALTPCFTAKAELNGTYSETDLFSKFRREYNS